MAQERKVERKDLMVEEVDEDGEVLCSILEVETGSWNIVLAVSEVYLVQLTNRDGGSCLLLPCALFTGSYALMLSVGMSDGE